MQNVKVEPFKLVGISVRTTNTNGQAAKDIQELWLKFMSENILSKIPNKVDDTVYSLYTEYEGDHTEPYTTIIGCKVSDINELPEEMVSQSFKGGNYVSLPAKGDITKGFILEQWQNIFTMDLNRAYTADFEVFGEKAQNLNDAEVDFLISVN